MRRTIGAVLGSISYQWQLSTDNITYVNVPTGGTGQDYTTDPLNVDTWYRRIVTSTLSVPGNADLACSKTSSPIKVTINNFTSSNTIAAPQTIDPPLTTVHQPGREKGSTAASLALHLRDEEPASHRVLAAELVVRSSTAVPPARPAARRP